MALQRICPRCHNVLAVEDEGVLIYCVHCGAPQITLSEELRTAAEQQEALSVEERNGTLHEPTGPPSAPWKSLIRVAAFTSLIFSATTVIIPPVVLLVFAIPAIALALFHTRHRLVRLDAGIGARLGVLCGLFTSFGILLAETVGLLLMRWAAHGAPTALDLQMTSYLARFQEQAANPADPASVEMVHTFVTVPEFRAGMYFSGLALVAVMLVALCAASGALAGYTRSRSRPA